jgi:hypothetical protein
VSPDCGPSIPRWRGGLTPAVGNLPPGGPIRSLNLLNSGATWGSFRRAGAGFRRFLTTDRRPDPFANRLEDDVKRRNDEAALLRSVIAPKDNILPGRFMSSFVEKDAERFALTDARLRTR